MAPQHGTDRRYRAVLIDDDEDTRQLMRDSLVRAGFTVDDFPDGETLMSHANWYAADVVVSDIGLPGIDGIAICAAARALDSPIPVLLVTAFRDEGLLRRALAAGASEIMHKPLNFAALAAHARSLAVRE